MEVVGACRIRPVVTDNQVVLPDSLLYFSIWQFNESIDSGEAI
jgi:hypothetical protein